MSNIYWRVNPFHTDPKSEYIVCSENTDFMTVSQIQKVSNVDCNMEFNLLQDFKTLLYFSDLFGMHRIITNWHLFSKIWKIIWNQPSGNVIDGWLNNEIEKYNIDETSYAQKVKIITEIELFHPHPNQRHWEDLDWFPEILNK